MQIGTVREIKKEEYRVGLTPSGTRSFTARGHTVLVEQGAGVYAGFEDAQYAAAGATLFGIGHLPMNSNYAEPVTLTLAYVPAEWAGRTIRVSAFDNDAGAQQVTFMFDTMPYDDWHHVGQLSGNDTWYHNVFTVPSAPDDTFYGGFLQAVYQAGGHDTFGWKITGEARPTLVQ